MSPQGKRVRRIENEHDETKAKKNFSWLPVQLRELVLSKTDTDTRLKLFQINNELREWVLKEELFGEDLETIEISEEWDSTARSETRTKIVITSRYGSGQGVAVPNQYVFKVVRYCKKFWFYNVDFDWTRNFPRLQSINHLGFGRRDFTKLSQRFRGTAIQVTGLCYLASLEFERVTTNIDEIFSEFIKNHLKRCKTIAFRQYPLEKFFNSLATQQCSQVIFEYWPSRPGDILPPGPVVDFETDLQMILSKGIPSLHRDSAVLMIIRSDRLDELIQIFNIISGRTDVLLENEVFEKEFLVSFEKMDVSPIFDPFDSQQWQFIDRSDVECFRLERKFDDTRKLIFLVCAKNDKIQIHIKFNPIEK